MADQRNRRALYENWRIVKSLWTDELTGIQGEFWKVPLPIEWQFNPTTHFGPGQVDGDGILRRIGITPRPLQSPHPPVYAPFSYSMETARFWAREGGKMVSFVRAEKEEFIPIMLEQCREAAQAVGRAGRNAEILALGGMIILGDTPQASDAYYRDFEQLWKLAYDAPPYHVPMGRVWSGDKRQVRDDVLRLVDAYEVDEIFVWHHVGYFGDDRERAALAAFAEAAIEPLR